MVQIVRKETVAARAAQIMELIKAFIDSVAAIPSGNVSTVAKSIENALGKAVPVLIIML